MGEAWDNYGTLMAAAYPDAATIEEHEFGDYQGDLVFILTDPVRGFGFGVVGYGSCSGCDWLLGETGDTEPQWAEGQRERFIGELAGMVRWFDDEDVFKAWVHATGNGLRVGEWYFYDKDMRAFLKARFGIEIKEAE